MDPRQQRIFDVLAIKHADLAGVYRFGLLRLGQRPMPGDERMRVSMICHAMREVMACVVRVWGKPSTSPIKPSTGKQVQELPDLLTRYPELQLSVDAESVRVPGEVALAMDRLIKTAVQEKKRSRDNVAALLTDDGNRGALAVSQWKEAQDFFVHWAHISSEPCEPAEIPDDAVIVANIRIFEDLFDAYNTQFFEVRRSIDDLLADINSQEEKSDG